MAMTDEELLLQMNILSSKISDNPNMTYKASKLLNKGLNPEYYSGNDTKVVNILNSIYEKLNEISNTALSAVNKVNEIVVDTSSTDGAEAWGRLQQIMGKDSIVQGLLDMYDGLQTDMILGLDPADEGKILSIAVNESGKAVLEAIDQILVNAEAIEYSHEKAPEVTNIKEAMDHIMDGLNAINSFDWDLISNKPDIIDNVVLTDEALEFRDDDKIVSSVQISSDDDIDQIINNL